MQDTLLKKGDQAAQKIDTLSESKKSTVASVRELDDQFSKIASFENLEGSVQKVDYGKNLLSQNETPIEIFDQKSHLELGDHKLHTLLQPDMLSQIDIQNEMSYQGYQ